MVNFAVETINSKADFNVLVFADVKLIVNVDSIAVFMLCS